MTRNRKNENEAGSHFLEPEVCNCPLKSRGSSRIETGGKCKKCSSLDPGSDCKRCVYIHIYTLKSQKLSFLQTTKIINVCVCVCWVASGEVPYTTVYFRVIWPPHLGNLQCQHL